MPARASSRIFLCAIDICINNWSLHTETATALPSNLAYEVLEFRFCCMFSLFRAAWLVTFQLLAICTLALHVATVPATSYPSLVASGSNWDRVCGSLVAPFNANSTPLPALIAC